MGLGTCKRCGKRRDWRKGVDGKWYLTESLVVSPANSKAGDWILTRSGELYICGRNGKDDDSVRGNLCHVSVCEGFVRGTFEEGEEGLSMAGCTEGTGMPKKKRSWREHAVESVFDVWVVTKYGVPTSGKMKRAADMPLLVFGQKDRDLAECRTRKLKGQIVRGKLILEGIQDE